MWKSNEGHKLKQLFSIMSTLPEKKRKRIEQSILPMFYEDAFCRINEKLFAPLYSEKASRPNCPGNVLVGLEILKYLFTLSDERLFDHFYMDLCYDSQR